MTLVSNHSKCKHQNRGRTGVNNNILSTIHLNVGDMSTSSASSKEEQMNIRISIIYCLYSVIKLFLNYIFNVSGD